MENLKDFVWVVAIWLSSAWLVGYLAGKLQIPCPPQNLIVVTFTCTGLPVYKCLTSSGKVKENEVYSWNL